MKKLVEVIDECIGIAGGMVSRDDICPIHDCLLLDYGNGNRCVLCAREKIKSMKGKTWNTHIGRERKEVNYPRLKRVGLSLR